MQFKDMAEEYHGVPLRKSDLAAEPVAQFKLWFQDWVATEPYDANAMIVATVDSEGWPSARAVLLKGLDARGFIFYTNRLSDKGRDIAASRRAALCFLWHSIERQVRVVGVVEHISDVESDAYFASRPEGAQIGAWASPQSSVINSRDDLVARVTGIASKFKKPTDTGSRVSRMPEGNMSDSASTVPCSARVLAADVSRVPRPDYWGGYLVRPLKVEFWQGRADRLHDRLRYSRSIEQSVLLTTESAWNVERLAP